MQYAVLGPRDFRHEEYKNYSYVAGILAGFADTTAIISGGSRGVESLVHTFAQQSNVEFILIPPVFRVRGERSAFFVRNRKIVDACDALIVFWDGKSTRIMDTLILAMERGKEVSLIPME